MTRLSPLAAPALVTLGAAAAPRLLPTDPPVAVSAASAGTRAA